MNSKNRSPSSDVFVVVHDAGGAQVIGAYMRANRHNNVFHAYGAGPAVAVFKRLGLPLHPVEDTSRSVKACVNRHRDAEYSIIAAPGWMSTIEFRAVQEAKKAGLKTIVYMDSWTDDRRRFRYPERGWQRYLPHEFWAADRYARANLKKRFPGIPVRFEPNQYVKTELKRYHSLKKSKKPGDLILFTSTIGGDSHELLKEILRMIAQKEQKTKVLIRYHPGDKHDRYRAIIDAFQSRVEIEESTEADLVKDLVRARLVIGTETMAMAIAFLCKIKTISYIYDRSKPILPFKGIKRIRSVRSIGRLI